MEQKAKRIGKLNIIDLIAIVLIVAVLALAVWNSSEKTGTASAMTGPRQKSPIR